MSIVWSLLKFIFKVVVLFGVIFSYLVALYMVWKEYFVFSPKQQDQIKKLNKYFINILTL